jgi:hypothetical protein
MFLRYLSVTTPQAPAAGGIDQRPGLVPVGVLEGLHERVPDEQHVHLNQLAHTVRIEITCVC